MSADAAIFATILISGAAYTIWVNVMFRVTDRIEQKIGISPDCAGGVFSFLVVILPLALVGAALAILRW